MCEGMANGCSTWPQTEGYMLMHVMTEKGKQYHKNCKCQSSDMKALSNFKLARVTDVCPSFIAPRDVQLNLHQQ